MGEEPQMSGLKVSEPPRQRTKRTKTKKEDYPSPGARRGSVCSGGLLSLHQCTDLDPLQNGSAHLDCLLSPRCSTRRPTPQYELAGSGARLERQGRRAKASYSLRLEEPQNS